MSTIQFSRETFLGLVNHPSHGPVVMLNLLKYRKNSGAAAYARYVDAFQPVLLRHGGRILYFGNTAEMLVGDGDDDWDAVVLVQYPSRKVFAEIIASPEYKALSKDRDEGLERTALFATDPRDATR